MLTQLAWKNVWRNKKRSLVIVLAITLGLCGGLLSGAIMMGMAESMVNSAIDRYLGHIQIHSKAFNDDIQISHTLKDINVIQEIIQSQDSIVGYSERTIIEGMAQSAASSFGVKIIGVDRTAEKKVTRLHEKVTEGGFLDREGKNQILIGRKLAERLNLGLRKKIILTYQNPKGEIVYLACRISGIFKTESSQFDESTVFLKQIDLWRSLNASGLIHEVAIRTSSSKHVDDVAGKLVKALPADVVQTWQQLSPELAFISTSMEAFTYLFVAIILFALLFGITNNMLMSVMERIRELGILTAVGMKKFRIFLMILLETILLSLSGGILGMIVGSVLIELFYTNGIDLSAFASGLESFGSGTMLYPFLPASMYMGLTLMILFAANIASLLPAWKATHLQPAEAIRTY
jgi:ABC-type lipoprotein release transport system permease subunit